MFTNYIEHDIMHNIIMILCFIESGLTFVYSTEQVNLKIDSLKKNAIVEKKIEEEQHVQDNPQ